MTIKLLPLSVVPLRIYIAITFGMLSFAVQASDSIPQMMPKLDFQWFGTASLHRGGQQWVAGEVYDGTYGVIQGGANLSVGRLPFTSRFRFNTLSALGGAPNYFTVQFDVRKFRDDLRREKEARLKTITSELDSLERRKAMLKRIIPHNNDLYAGSINPLDTAVSLENLQHPFEVPKSTVPSLETFHTGEPFDTLGYGGGFRELSSIDTLQIASQATMTTGLLQSTLSQGDIDLQLFTLERKIGSLRGELEELQDAVALPIDSLPSVENAFSKVNKLALGVVAPTWNVLSLNGARYRGLDIEVESKGRFVALTGGMLAPAFQFGSPRDFIDPEARMRFFSSFRQGELLAIKGGKRSSTGVTLAAGYVGGIERGGPVPEQGTDRRGSQVLFAEFGYRTKSIELAIVPAIRADLIGSQVILVSEGKGKALRNGLSGFGFDATARVSVPKIYSEVTALTQYVGPLYYNVGSPFLMNDMFKAKSNVRYTRLSWLTPEFGWSHTRNNVLDLATQTTFIEQLTTGVTIKPTKAFTVTGKWLPTTVTLANEAGSTESRSDFILLQALWLKPKKKITPSAAVLYSRMVSLFFGELLISETATVQCGIRSKRLELSATYSEIGFESASGQIPLRQLEASTGWQSEKMKVLLSGARFSTEQGQGIVGRSTAEIALTGKFSCSLSAEYSEYLEIMSDIFQLNAFTPYSCTVQFIKRI